jgi:hypothetical protein
MPKKPQEHPFGARRGTPERPLVIKRRKYIYVAAAAREVNISSTTLFDWAKAGVTSWGLDLEVYTHLGYKLFIPKSKVLALKKQLKGREKSHRPVSEHLHL